jgi:hypothetical protein
MIWHACGVLTLADESEKHPQQPKVTAPLNAPKRPRKLTPGTPETGIGFQQ